MANIKLKIDDELLKKARRLALRRKTSINAIVRKGIEEFVSGDLTREDAVKGWRRFSGRARPGSGQRPGPGTNSMKDKVFLDTNVFIYSVDSSPDHIEKADIARQIVKQHVKSGTGVISIQVLQEFYQVSTQKIQIPLSTENALEYLHYMSLLETVHPDFNLLVTAVYLHKRLKLSFWNALIVQAAAAAECTILFTEDLQDGLNVGNLIIRNPFIAHSFVKNRRDSNGATWRLARTMTEN